MKTWLGRRQGNILIGTALCLPPLVGCGGDMGEHSGDGGGGSAAVRADDRGGAAGAAASSAASGHPNLPNATGGTATSLAVRGNDTGGTAWVYVPVSDAEAGSAGTTPLSPTETKAADLASDAGPVTALFVFDKSGSMSSAWYASEEADPASLTTKWQAASDALVGAVAPVQDRVTAAAILFPQPTDCEVVPLGDERQLGFQPGSQFLDAWQAAGTNNGPSGATPLGTALSVTDEAIQDARAGGLLEERFIVVLLTDGEPNCDTDIETVTRWPEEWLAQGIPTYVFGLPGSDSASSVLDAIARAGGTAAHVAPGSPGELEQGMAAAL